MRDLLCLLLLMLSSLVQAQENADRLSEKKIDPLLAKIRAGQASPLERSEAMAAAAALQNNGQALEERNHDYKKSMQSIDRAIALYEALGDTLNLAFSKKYRGHLLVRLNKIGPAKTDIRSAIQLYRLANTGAGAASAQFDMARVFEFENKPDSAIYYASLAGAYWKLQANNLQSLVINNMMVYHLLQLNQTEKATAFYQESQSLLAKQPTHWQPLLDFYFTAMMLFRQTNDMGNASHYRGLYENKKAELQASGIAAKSYYEAEGQ